MRKRVAFIIISYVPDKNALHTLLNACKDYPVIVVDNGGTLTQDDVGNATLLPQAKNLGFGAAANRGIHHASGHGAEWFVILNQDVVFSKETVRLLTKQLATSLPSITGPFIGDLDSKRWTTQLPARVGIDYITGSCMAIHSKVVSKIGYFFEPYFLYYEDVDYCVRARRAGFPLIQLLLPDVRHEETQSLGKGSYRHQYYLARNHFIFVKRLSPHSVKFYEMLRGIKTLGEHIIRREIGALVGIWDFLLGRYGDYEGRGV